MTKEIKTETTEVKDKKVDVEPAAEEVEDIDPDAPAEEEETENSEKNDDPDYDAEIDRETKLGKPDPEAAKKAFQERKNKREDGDDIDDEPEDDEDKPLTRRELADALAKDRKERQETEAFSLAKSLAGSDKEAQLILAKWKNRTFPSGLPLSEQIQEMYVVTHSKKLIGQKNEAFRALKNGRGVNRDGSGTHQDAPENPTAPKVSTADAQAFVAAGMTYNVQTRRYEKKLANGNILVRDPKTKKSVLIRPAAK